MKKSIYIGLLLMGLFVVSCAKEDIRPNAVNNEVPVWGAFEKGDDDIIDDEDDPGDGGGITDPNNDPDGNSKKKP